ncbi:hypothetical protein CF326_g1310 [Tilletia indica]|nr:hypothetical protein CF326_g1310 [Tilletia indica]
MPPARTQPHRATRATRDPYQPADTRPVSARLRSADTPAADSARLRASESQRSTTLRQQNQQRRAAHRARQSQPESSTSAAANVVRAAANVERRREQLRNAAARYRRNGQAHGENERPVAAPHHPRDRAPAARQVEGSANARLRPGVQVPAVGDLPEDDGIAQDADRGGDGEQARGGNPVPPEQPLPDPLPNNPLPPQQPVPADAPGWWDRQQAVIDRLEEQPNSLRCHWLPSCEHCGAARLDYESRPFCCKDGTKMAPLPPLTPLLQQLSTLPVMATSSLHMNQVFQFAVQWYSGTRIRFGPGPPAVAVEGTITRRVLPVDRDHSPLNTYLYNPQQLEEQEVDGITLLWRRGIRRELERFNTLLHEFRQFQAEPTATVLELRTEGPAREIATVLHYGAGANKTPRSFYVHRAEADGPSRLSYDSELYEPLSYPVLFPHGTPGWPIPGWTQREYYRFLLLTERRFQDFAMLGSLYVIDMMCRIEDQRLAFVTRGLARARQNSRAPAARQALPHEIDEHVPDEGAIDPQSYDARLPSSFVGSRSYRAEHVSDALALAKRYGKPHGMLTLTTNPEWDELKEMLGQGQTATNVPIITVRVFRARMAKVLALFKRHFGPLLYLLKVIEFQRRGLPHAHIVFALERECPIELLDKVVSAEVPPETQPRLRELVLRFMRHSDDHIIRRDGTPNTASRCNKDGRCVWGFPHAITAETTVDPVTERVIYRRRTAEDQMIAQYPPLILLAWEGHAHIDFSVSLESFVYIFKYIHKGPDYVDFRFAEPAQDFQEAASRAGDDYIRARYLSATEATWRIMALDLTSKTPSVARLGVHEPGANVAQYSVSATPGSDASSLMRYFLRPDAFEGMTYTLYNESVTFRRPSDEELADPAQLMDGEVLEKREPGQLFRPQVVKPRLRRVKVARIKAVRPGAGEIFYIRYLLIHKAASNWEELKTTASAEGVRTVHATFQEAAVAEGLFAGTNEASQTMQEAVSVFSTPQQLRFLYCLLVVDGALALSLWDEFKITMSRDFLPRALDREPSDAEQEDACAVALRAVGRIFASMGKMASEYGLEVVIVQGAEATVDRNFFANRAEDLRQSAARARLRFTDTQRRLYEELMGAVISPNENKLHLIQGRAGRGKTFVVQAVIDQLRASERVLAVTGATGLAASAFARGATVHKMFYIPVVDDLDATSVTSKLRPDDRRWEFLADCSAIVIDEIWALHRSVIEAVDAVMRLITQTDEPFGGKVVFAVGDPRQTAPVVKGGGQTQLIENSFLSSPLFPHFRLHELTDSMRNGDDAEFSDWVDQVGDAWNTAEIDIGSYFRATVRIQEAQEFLFPGYISDDADACAKRAFLSPYNAAVAEFNARVLETLPGAVSVSNSFDSVKGDVEEGQENLASPDFLNTLDQPGTPPHQLKLKVGALCVVMRNFSAADGLVKNAKVAVVRAGQRSVTVRILSTGAEFTLPKITFEFQPAYFPFVIVRKQIPLKLAYALTFHGCQGATLDRTVVDCRLPVFTHGQRYASVSRCRHRSHTVALLSDTMAEHIDAARGTRPIQVNNIVYREFVEAGQHPAPAMPPEHFVEEIVEPGPDAGDNANVAQ